MYLSPNNTNKHTVFFQKNLILSQNELILPDLSIQQPSVIKIIFFPMPKLSQWLQTIICGQLQNMDLIWHEAGQRLCPLPMPGT